MEDEDLAARQERWAYIDAATSDEDWYARMAEGISEQERWHVPYTHTGLLAQRYPEAFAEAWTSDEIKHWITFALILGSNRVLLKYGAPPFHRDEFRSRHSVMRRDPLPESLIAFLVRTGQAPQPATPDGVTVLEMTDAQRDHELDWQAHLAAAEIETFSRTRAGAPIARFVAEAFAPGRYRVRRDVYGEVRVVPEVRDAVDLLVSRNRGQAGKGSRPDAIAKVWGAVNADAAARRTWRDGKRLVKVDTEYDRVRQFVARDLRYADDPAGALHDLGVRVAGLRAWTTDPRVASEMAVDDPLDAQQATRAKFDGITGPSLYFGLARRLRLLRALVESQARPPLRQVEINVLRRQVEWVEALSEASWSRSR